MSSKIKIVDFFKYFGLMSTSVQTAFSYYLTPSPIEGNKKPGDQVANNDEVATTRGSNMKAIERVCSGGLDGVRAVVLADRQEAGIEPIREHAEDISAISLRDEV
jgi:orotate phosphoribosyltransferase